MNLKITAVLIFALLFQACTSDTRISQARERLEQQIKNESKGFITLKKIDKINGQESILLGSKIYEMDFKIIIEYRNDCYKDIDTWGGLANNYFTVVKDPQQVQRLYGAYTPSNFRHYTKGTKEELTGVAYYEMKENGWSLSDLNLKSAKQTE